MCVKREEVDKKMNIYIIDTYTLIEKHTHLLIQN